MRANQGRPDTLAQVGAVRSASAATSGAVAGHSRWERWNDASMDWGGYVLLAISSFFALVRPDPPSERLVTLGIVGVTVAWVYLLYTRAPAPRHAERARMLVYVIGLLALAGLLMTRNPIFFVFAISGYFHASLLRPWPLTILAVFATSVLINVLITGFPWPTLDLWILFSVVIVVQTVAIGFGSVVGVRLNELSEQRRVLLAERDAAIAENRGLHEQLVAQAREAGVLDERARMAREIHDTIAHGLTGIVTQLEAAEQAASRNADWTRHVDNALRLARESLTEARRSVEASRPQALVDASLQAALGDLAQRWSSLYGITTEFTLTGDAVPLHPDIEVAILRTAQEALANVAKHARATRVGLTLSYMGDVVTLDVRDDGVGFRVPAGSDVRGTGFGLSAMRQRVHRVAGTLAIESEPGAGTAGSARVPAIVAPGIVGRS